MPQNTRVVTCSWCNRPVIANTGRMRLHQSETVRFSGNVVATFHIECGDALLDYLEQRTAGAELEAA